MNDAKSNIAVILSGVGVYDGSEIHEAVLTLLAIENNGASYCCFAPNKDQAHVINHLTGEEMTPGRNVLVEAARIARGEITDLADFDAAKVDALILPGGFGAAKNLCSFAFDGPDCAIQEDVKNAITTMVEAKKPIGSLCISPVILAKILDRATLTIGQDEETTKAIEAMGGVHQKTNPGEVVVDERLKLVTSPCYMLESTIPQIAEGCDNTVKAVLKLL
jgi:enhancing lycopene biosynthesis protein 2